MKTEGTILRTARHEHERSVAVWVLTVGLLIAVVLTGAAMTAGASTAAADTFVDSDRADFQLGTLDDGVYVGTSGTGSDGELQLKPDAALGGEAHEFDGVALPLGWESTPWAAGGTASVGAGALVVDGARAGSIAQDVLPGHAIEFVASFAPREAFQHVGVGVTYENPPWAIFSTRADDGRLWARTAPDTPLEQDTLIPTVDLSVPHRYRIEWTATQVRYLVDEQLVNTDLVSPPGPLRPLASDFEAGGGALSVYWLRMSPYAPATIDQPESFTSRVFDAGQTGRWRNLQASPTVRAGTGAQIQTRTGNSAQPDGTWSDWQALGAGGEILSPDRRYIQYRAQLSTTDPVMLTPTINRVAIDYVPNAAPVIDVSSASASAQYSDAITPFTIRAHDADGDPLSFTTTTLPDGLALVDNGDGTATVSGRLNVPPGTYSPSFTVSDGHGGADTGTATITVAKKELTVTAQDKSKTYGDPDPAFTASYSGFASGQDENVLGTQPSCGVAGAHSNAGSYAISCAGGADNNYSFQYVPGTLTVAKATLTANISDETITYGDTVPSFSVTTYSGFKGSDTSSVVNGTLSCDSSNHNAGGPYAVTCSGLSAANYAIGYQGGSLTVKKAEVAINANDVTALYGDTPVLTYSLSGFKNNETKDTANVTGKPDCSIAGGAGPDVGVYPAAITCAPGDPATGGLKAPNYGFATGAKGKLTITKAPTTLIYTGEQTKQYSDVADLKAVLTTGSKPVANKTIKFTIGSQEKEATTGSDGVASASLKIDQAPGSPGVLASFAGDDNYVASTNSKTFSVTQEDARATYTGALFASTSSATSSNATVTLSSTIQDISDVSGDSASDSDPGDIRNAKVDFVKLEDSTPLCSNLPVGLVSSSDTKVGTATCNWAANIGTQNSISYTIGIKVNGHYLRYNPTDNAVVTVAKPLDSFISGGGYLVNQQTAGLVAGDKGKKTNFGFNVKYNKTNTNLQGGINTIVRKGSTTYQIKGNAMTSLSTSLTTGKATFNGKASIQDITNPTSPVSVDGNATLQVVLTDNGQPGSSDTVGITVWNKSGGLWFSSNWSGTNTLEQRLDGGNLVVR